MEDPIVYKDPDHAEVGLRCGDTSLTTEDGTVFHVNSELLSRHSTLFNYLFSMGEETGQNTVIDGIKPDILRIILAYLSNEEVLLTTENIIDLLVASDFLMIESLLNECRKFVLQVKSAENLMRYFIIANRIKGLDLEDQCRRFLVLCFEKAFMHSMDEACCLPYEELEYFLSHRSLNVSHERTVWSIIEAWVQKDPVDRHPFVPKLLRCLSAKEINVGFAWNSPIIKADTLLSYRNEPPILTGARLPQFLHVVAKNSLDGERAELYLSYDDSLDLWRKVGVISLNEGRIFVSGHFVYYLERTVNSRHYELSGFYYDLLKNEEKRMSHPDVRKYVVGAVGGDLYALEIYSNIIKRYDHESDEWDVKPVRYERGYVSGALNVNGLLHVLDEFHESSRMFMRVYDPSKEGWRDQWRRGPSPTVRRFFAVSAVYQGKIFLVAGQIDVDESDDEDNGEEIGEGDTMEGNGDLDDKDKERDSDDVDIDRFEDMWRDIADFMGEVDSDDSDESVDEERDDECADDPPDVSLNVINKTEGNGSDDLDDKDKERDSVDVDMDRFDDMCDIADNSDNDFEDAPPDLLQNPIDNNIEEAMDNIEQDESISRAVEVYDPKSKKWVIYPDLPFRFCPVFASVVKDRLYVYQNPQRPVTYWDGSGQWKIMEDPSLLFQHKFSAVTDQNVVRQIMKRNKKEDLSVWLETGLEKVFP